MKIRMKVKRITALLLVFAMLLSFCPAAFAEGKESKEEYGILPVTTFPSKKAYTLKMMVVGDEIYVKADMIAEILGYKYSSTEDYAVISNSSIGRVIAFQADSAKLRYINGIGRKEAIVFNYSMPYKAVSNDKGFWVPYLYAINLMDSCYLCTSKTLCKPNTTVLGQMADISRKKDSYKFDAVTDLGDSKARQKLCYFVTYLNGLNYLSGIDLTCISPITFEIKYIDQLATLFCSPSQNDIGDVIDDMSLLYDTLNDTNTIQGIYKAADIMDKYADQKLEYAMKEFLMAMDTQEIRSSYVDEICTDLDRALDNKLFSMKASKTAEKIKKGWEKVDEKNAVTWANLGIQFLLYCNEMRTLDRNSVTAFKGFADYLNDGRDHNISSLSALTLSDYMNNGDNQAYLLGKAVFSTLVNGFDDEVDLANGDLGDALLDSSSLYKLGWSLAERFWPPLREGLDNADKTTLLRYSEILQDESRRWYGESLDELYSNPSDLENWRQYVESTYTMLRMCYLSREMGCDIIQTYIDSGINTDADNSTLTKYKKSINAVNQKISADEARYYRLIKSEKDNKETDSVSSFCGMIPPVEAKIKKNYKASDAKVKPQIQYDWYEYIDTTLIPEYGYADTKATKKSVTFSNAEKYWDKRDGIISALITDYTLNGKNDLLLFYLKSRSDGQSLCVRLYTRDENKKIQSSVPLELNIGNATNYEQCKIGMMRVKDIPYVYVESCESGYWADWGFYDTKYNWYCYDGEKWYSHWMIGQAEEGTSGVPFSLITRDGSKKSTERVIYADEEYLYLNPRCKPVLKEINSYKDIAKAGFNLIGLLKSNTESVKDLGQRITNCTYWNTDYVTPACTYLCSGKGDMFSKIIVTVTVTDYTDLKNNIGQ